MIHEAVSIEYFIVGACIGLLLSAISLWHEKAKEINPMDLLQQTMHENVRILNEYGVLQRKYENIEYHFVVTILYKDGTKDYLSYTTLDLALEAVELFKTREYKVVTLFINEKVLRSWYAPKTFLTRVSDRVIKLVSWFFKLILLRPHFLVGGSDNPYLRRWFLIPPNRFCNIYLHQFLRSDDDRAQHDHPWNSLSFLIKGRYVEHTPFGSKTFDVGSVIYREAAYTHQIELIDDTPCWTIFITGKKLREWGFWCPQGWRHWKVFTDADDEGSIGRGCK